jgi:hypothetical protein
VRTYHGRRIPEQTGPIKSAMLAATKFILDTFRHNPYIFAGIFIGSFGALMALVYYCMIDAYELDEKKEQ